jgi:hypothetical protein
MPNNNNTPRDTGTQQTNNERRTVFSREQHDFLFSIANKTVEEFKLQPLEVDQDDYLEYVLDFMNQIADLIVAREPESINMDVYRRNNVRRS